MDIFSALLDYRRRHVAELPPHPGYIPSSESVSHEAVTSNRTQTPVDGQTIAYLFSKEAEKCLSKNEVCQLLAFLKRPCSSAREGASFGNLMAQKLREFYEEEVVESGEPRNLLSEPAGPETANFGIILHIRTRKQAEVGSFPFFDLQNRTIQLLAKKGVSDSFTYMFDWHWRAELWRKSRSRCSTLQWRPEVKHLHNQLSSYILDTLPLPLLLIGGDCAQRQHLSTLLPSASTIKISVGPSCTLDFVFDFRHSMLR
ncbi:hypothetical protein GQ53DRAFT_420051 [Thozetella sp. PMI_491]|nr:hypothetical protein GQ53DRAFT_420051 [Thozetella sp. PMI_491]